jgi:hypothetical protein
MSSYRDRDDKPHLALGQYTGQWLVFNIHKLQDNTPGLLAACSWVCSTYWKGGR